MSSACSLFFAFADLNSTRFINIHVRSDKQNQLKLRVEMTEEDKAIVRSARKKESATRESAVLLREKMARESIFATIPID